MARKRHSRIHACPVAEGARIQVGTATAFAVRKESRDVALRIRRERHPVRDRMEGVPFLRGIVRLTNSVLDFLDGVAESADLEPQRVVKGSRFEQRFAELFRIHPTSFVSAGSVIAMVVLIPGLMWALPWALEKFLLMPYGLSRSAVNAICCAARVLCAFALTALIPRLRVVNRFCMYRGAINAVLNARDRRHRGDVRLDAALKADYRTGRSDAAFIALVVLLSLILFSLIRTFTLPVQVLVRALIVLCVAAVVNEPLRALETRMRKRWARTLLAPMRALERLFVRKPNPQMVEVAVYAFNAAQENDR